MRVLITGIYGFIASQFARQFYRDFEIVGFGRDTNPKHRKRVEGLPIRLVHGDLNNPNDVSGILEDIDVVIHAAAKTFVDHSILDPLPFIQSNIIGTYNLLEQARKYKPKLFINVSTDEVYGAILEGAYKEDARLNPTNPYSSTKAAADMLALAYFNTYKLPVIITRTENNYGPYQHPQKVMPKFIAKALRGEKLPVYGDGKHVRMWLHVSDHCSALKFLAEKGKAGEIYHIAGEQELENVELARRILRLLNKPEDQIEFIDDFNIRPGHDRRYALDTSKLRSLGWHPEVSLEKGLKQTVEWYRNNQWWFT